MAFIPVPNVMQVELVYNWNGSIVENVLHYLFDAVPNVDDAGTLGTALVTWWNDHMKTKFSHDLSLINIKMSDLSSQAGMVVDWNSGLPIVGTDATNSTPSNVALVFTKRTAKRGRSYRGRLYHGGMGVGGFDGSVANPAYVAAAITAYNLLLTVEGGDPPAPLVVVSRYNNGIARIDGVATPVTRFTCDGVADSQRRRLPGRGA